MRRRYTKSDACRNRWAVEGWMTLKLSPHLVQPADSQDSSLRFWFRPGGKRWCCHEEYRVWDTLLSLNTVQLRFLCLSQTLLLNAKTQHKIQPLASGISQISPKDKHVDTQPWWCVRRNTLSFPSLLRPTRQPWLYREMVHGCSASSTCSPNCSASIVIIPWPLPSFASPLSPGSIAITMGSHLRGNLEISTLKSHPGWYRVDFQPTHCQYTTLLCPSAVSGKCP